MALLTVLDLQRQFGPLIRLSELAAYLGTSTRALRSLLRAHNIEPIVIGSAELIQVYRAAAALGLKRKDVLEDQADYEERRRALTYRADGTHRTLTEFREIVEATPTTQAER